MSEHTFADPQRSTRVQQTVEQNEQQSAPRSFESANISDLQRMLGNKGLQRMLAQHKIQAKLTVGAANDVYEQEADRVASEVMSAPAAEPIQREAEDEELQMKRVDIQREAEEEELQMKRVDIQREVEGGEMEDEELLLKRDDAIQRENVDMSGSFDVDNDVESQINSSKGGGQSLPSGAQDFFESRFGQDFGDVRVHASSQADTLNRSIGARAFTNGSDIFMQSNEYNPDSSSGRELLAHELTHVVQQTGGKPTAQPKRDEQ